MSFVDNPFQTFDFDFYAFKNKVKTIVFLINKKVQKVILRNLERGFFAIFICNIKKLNLE